jgi:hypothetical protein
MRAYGRDRGREQRADERDRATQPSFCESFVSLFCKLPRFRRPRKEVETMERVTLASSAVRATAPAA